MPNLMQDKIKAMRETGNYPCKVNGEHEVVNIRGMMSGDSDEGERILLSKGYRYRATCKHCNGSIVAKDKTEYKSRG